MDTTGKYPERADGDELFDVAPPLVGGGQGRSGADVQTSAFACAFWLVVAAIVVAMVTLIGALWSVGRRTP